MDIDPIRTFQGLTPYMTEYSKDIVETFSLGCVSIRRTYDDGAVVWITSNPTAISEFCERKLPLPRATYNHPSAPASNQGVYIWEESIPTINLTFAMERYKLISGISLYNYQENYCDVMAFNLCSNLLIQPLTFYAYALPSLWRFTNEWLKNHGHILDTLYQKKIILQSKPTPKHNIHTMLKEFRENPLYIQNDHTPLKLTPQEAVLLMFLREGKTFHDMRDLTNKSLSRIKKCTDVLCHKIGRPIYDIPNLLWENNQG